MTRKARPLPDPLSPFMLCLIGMTAGMVIDHQRTHFLMLDVCTGDAGPLKAIERHFATMPNMYLGAALAAAIGLCRDVGATMADGRGKHALVRTLGRTGLMLGGMVAASLAQFHMLGMRHPAGEWLAMTLGMLGGHAICAKRRIADG